MKPFRISADGDTRLGLRSDFSGSRSRTVCAGTIPLWQTAASCGAKNVDTNQPGIFGVRRLQRSIKLLLRSRCTRKRSERISSSV